MRSAFWKKNELKGDERIPSTYFNIQHFVWKQISTHLHSERKKILVRLGLFNLILIQAGFPSFILAISLLINFFKFFSVFIGETINFLKLKSHLRILNF